MNVQEQLQRELEAMNQQINTLEAELEESKAETAACLHFLETEMGWEYFRVEFKLGSRESVSISEQNAERLSAYLREKGHGLRYRGAVERKLAIARRALEYYANKDNWDVLPKLQMSSWDDCLQINEGTGYAVAAKALAEIEQPQRSPIPPVHPMAGIAAIDRKAQAKLPGEDSDGEPCQCSACVALRARAQAERTP